MKKKYCKKEENAAAASNVVMRGTHSAIIRGGLLCTGSLQARENSHHID